MEIYTGCSSFYNRLWKGVFYPEGLAQSKWFAYYCEHFNTFEINSTFYNFPTEKTLESWYNKSPEGFQFAVKAPRLITHYKKLKECTQELDDFYRVCKKGLKEKLGVVLFQFPPSFKYSEESLELILKSMNHEFKNAIEFRDPSWWHTTVYDALEANNLIFCSVSHPKLPNSIIVTSTSAYVRLHGNPQLFYSSYSDDYLLNLHADLVNEKKLKEAFVFFNNTASTAGILNAQKFKSILFKKSFLNH